MSKEESLIRVMEDDPQVVKAYNAVPVLEQTKLPRGGVSVETKAVGRVQVGIVIQTKCDTSKLSTDQLNLVSNPSVFFLCTVWNSSRNHQGQYAIGDSRTTSLHCASGTFLS